jgi:hypothetical protein
MKKKYLSEEQTIVVGPAEPLAIISPYNSQILCWISLPIFTTTLGNDDVLWKF